MEGQKILNFDKDFPVHHSDTFHVTAEEKEIIIAYRKASQAAKDGARAVLNLPNDWLKHNTGEHRQELSEFL